MLQEKLLTVQITDNDIKYAESILLGEGEHFDAQRKTFIKNLATIDLQAVPGSGKTTALLAKLLILEKYLPLKKGSGVLVLSHTNAAVDQIIERIGKHCPRLFAYPNYIGTIQSCVDRFLAIPYYSNTYQKRPIRIDNEIYEEKVYCPPGARTWIDNHSIIGKTVLYGSRLNENDELVYGFNLRQKFPLRTKTGVTYKAILGMKQNLRNKGILCFDDAYFLAKKYIERHPIIKAFLRKRFNYVFVDEMQDMDVHQYELLENIFGEGSETIVYQRIGDRNQAIYGSVKSDDVWENTGKTVLSINGSCRFSQEIAKVVQSFSLTRETIQSVATHTSIRPHLLVYQDNTITQVLDKYLEVLKKHQQSGCFPSDPVHPIKAIGWRKTRDKDHKIILESYCPTFTAKAVKTKVDYPNILNYLIFGTVAASKANGLSESRKNILNAILKILRLENILTNDGRVYTKRILLEFLKESHIEEYSMIKLQLYRCCRHLHCERIKEAHEELKQYLPEFLRRTYGLTTLLEETLSFLNSNNIGLGSEGTEDSEQNRSDNIYRKDNLEVQIGTIHSAKGETHSATLYVETYYQNDGGKSYESERLKDSFMGEFAPTRTGKHVKESLKMAYVGMSRPTHLLCVAVHKDRIDDYITEIPNDLWEVVEV